MTWSADPGRSEGGSRTVSSSVGRSSPLLMPRFMETNRCRLGLSLTLGLWRVVLSMTMAKERM